jgi:hypothetical protein
VFWIVGPWVEKVNQEFIVALRQDSTPWPLEQPRGSEENPAGRETEAPRLTVA